MKDAVSYLRVIDNPYDAVSLARIANRPRRGIGDSSLARLASFADTQRISLWEALDRADEAGAAAPRSRRSARSAACMESLMAGALELDVPDLVEKVLERSGYLEALRAERTVEAEGRIENLQELVGVAREYQPSAVREPGLSEFLQQISLFSDQDALAEREPRHADDAPQRQGPRVSRRLPDRDGGGSLPALALDRGAGGRGGATPRLRRSHACAGTAHAHARELAHAVGLARLQPPEPLPRRAAGGRDRAGAAPPVVLVGLCGGAEVAEPRDEHPQLSTGDSVRHGSLGEGIVTQIEPGGIVTVRFAGDSTERRLMLDYAPLERI